MGADRLKEIKDNAERGWNRAGKRLFSPSQLSLLERRAHVFAPVLSPDAEKQCGCSCR